MNRPKSHNRIARLLAVAGFTCAVLAVSLAFAPMAGAASADADDNYQSCDDAQLAQRDGLITIKRADTVDPDKRWVVRRAYNITAEIYPPYNAPGWGNQLGFVRVYVNGKVTTSTIGKVRPTSEIQHGRFNAWRYQNSGDLPWTHHKVSGGDIIRLDWSALLSGNKGEEGAISGSLSCRA